MPGQKLVSENVNSNSSNDFSGIKPGRDNQGGEGKEMCSNFSAISAQLTRKGLRRRPEGELIDLGAALPLGERGTGQLRMKAQSGKYAGGKNSRENGR